LGFIFVNRHLLGFCLGLSSDKLLIRYHAELA
jgi:hypothetical protein